MFNVVINNEQYDEFLGQKARIKELENRNEFLTDLVDAYRLKAITANGMYHHEHIKNNEHADLNDKIKTLKVCNAVLKTNLEATYGNYQKALSENAALIKERNELINERSELYIENEELKNKNIRFKELVTDNYRLKMSNNDLKENNKKLKKQNAVLKDQNEDLINELAVRCATTSFDDLEGAYSPGNTTNNYFSEEDEDNE